MFSEGVKHDELAKNADRPDRFSHTDSYAFLSVHRARAPELASSGFSPGQSDAPVHMSDRAVASGHIH